MASFQGCATVLSANIHTPKSPPRTFGGDPKVSLAAQDASKNLDSIQRLFVASDARDDGELRGEKRRKLDNGDAIPVNQVEFEDNKSVVLAKVSFDLDFGTASQDQMGIENASSSSQTSIVASFETFYKSDPDAFEVRLFNTATGAGVDIVATTHNDLLRSIAPHLYTAASLATSRHGKKSRPVTRASFCRCLLVPPRQDHNKYRLEVEIRWMLGLSVVEEPSVKTSYMKDDLRLLSKHFPNAAARADTKWSLSDFYESVHVPPADLQVSPRIQQSLSETLLYPFQQRAVDWLLKREGVAFSSTGQLESCIELTPSASFTQMKDAFGKRCDVSQLRGMIVTDPNEARGDTLQSLRGGMLAEEMGLGKTVELIALMSHHKRNMPNGNVFDIHTGAHVKPSGATLIITPPSILEQWISEIHTHAPELRVLHYKGLLPSSTSKNVHDVATVENLMRYDVVLTTYNVLSKEIHFATPPPDRSLRKKPRHERRKSPLIEISWWRVCLDEAQMVESGVSQAARVARTIPRCNAWAITGTPLRKDVQDLRGLLIFLRCDAFHNKTVWDRLDKSSFKAVFNQIALRHTKDKVRDELRLPPQKRVVITVPFTAIEEQNYSEMIRQMCDACWLSPEGNPLDEDRDVADPEVIERMREWLVRLRQTCLHAHVGRKNRRALGAKNGALRTVHEVLEVMIEQNDTNTKAEARDMILHHIQMGHVKAYAGNVDNRAETALRVFQDALTEAQAYVASCRSELLLEIEKAGNTTTSDNLLAVTGDEVSDGEEEMQNDHTSRLAVMRKSLRSFLELEHACTFFIGTTYHQMQSAPLIELDPEETLRLNTLELEWYAKAQAIRRELLTESKNRAQQQMAIIESTKSVHRIPDIEDLQDFGGIESRKFLDMMDNISDFMNAQAKQIETWRTNIIDILLTRLVDDDNGDEDTGEELAKSVEQQDELYVYMMAYRTLVADRSTAVHGLKNELVDHEIDYAENQTREKEPQKRGHAPELVVEVAHARRKLQSILEVGSLKGVISSVRSLLTSLQWKADGGDSRAIAELNVVQKHFARIQVITTDQAKIVTAMEKEQDMFRTTMNQRLEYYRQFQHISDTVGKWKEELDETFDEREYDRCKLLHKRKGDLVATLKKKHAYLVNLRRENREDIKNECVICQDEIQIGVLTTCGHKYCKECINIWWTAHRSCPMCKQKLGSSDFKNINFKPSEIKAQEEIQDLANSSQASSPGSSNLSIYSDMSSTTMNEIKNIDLSGSYGTKIDMIARHLLWIRANDPGAKSIIFSQFGDFLSVLREALKKWKIGVSGIAEKDGILRFKNDTAVNCFLLDAKSDSSGLNLVNATYVFLCEPLINPAIELQAIARVHRIGQQRPTTVFMYLVSDTVEEAIYNISVARRLEHMSKAKSTVSDSDTSTPGLQEKSLDKANSAELQAAPLKQLLRTKGDGEIVKADDLWRCLFGNARGDPNRRQALEREMGRHLRGEAAEGRIAEAEESI
ncbi:hypothetical protein P153DRAFT_427863 [Dothidotthia symphoricarpi CBS 119687]|uniref:ATP-dependent DNA helicase n=1 Tax=Dothidotthia symphoricarpi CBS 119687 TaxID=1392245 RepID=A0A6A6ASL9_9PLEO|nr:uncharacterized protein P153DRAFT_427863 [Dothidotthia symphoricarpi CBS 119687]KAF2133985.1 hypothetical protein P153DRAFT_427863 [Dothidotthia symphoricarpi CBS 119687]